MRSTSSEPPGEARTYSCSEPWTGVLSIETNRDVTFCPCYLKLKVGNLDEASIPEIWNAPPLVRIRQSFRAGMLPAVCEGQLCPPVLGETD